VLVLRTSTAHYVHRIATQSYDGSLWFELQGEAMQTGTLASYMREGVELAANPRYKPANEIIDEWSFQL
jgi:hypothetical protein